MSEATKDVIDQESAGLPSTEESASAVGRPSPSTFEVGRIYNRRTDIHARFGGQQQGGISTPSGQPYIFLFTGPGGEQHGYRDGWDENGVFLYTGEGQVGNMAFIRGNAAIRDHIAEGKDLLLFESLGKGEGSGRTHHRLPKTLSIKDLFEDGGIERRFPLFAGNAALPRTALQQV
jgi:hypothetical protein